MCFPSKRQKDNFADAPAAPKPQSENGAKAEAATTNTPAATATVESTPAAPVSASTVPPTTTSTAEPTPMAPKVAIVIYSLYGHISKMAEAVKAGIAEAGGSAEIFQVPETLPEEILKIMHAPPKGDYPIITPDDLATYDAFILGVPTRYGNMPGQWKAFWDATGQLWAQGKLSGKYAGVFVSTASLGGGQETTALSLLSTFTHHGINFVPLGYASTFAQLTNMSEVHGGSAWGAGTLAGGDGSRQPSELELKVATIQGSSFWKTVSKVQF
ncbi:NADH-quinone oxidoreductase [Cyathus striatus]|nr:NADH-quinone oxidoreductase [Cyathus striatus]